jgi:hypothetical protein
MKSILALALGLMLLVSASAATGTSNRICVEIDQESNGNCITGLDLRQVTDASTFVYGCDNEVEQFMNFYANDNDLVGYGDATGLSQIGKMIGNASGTCNDIDQNILFEAYENCLTDSQLTQFGIEQADAIGCNNEIEQLIGTGSEPYDPNEANYNKLTCSELIQWSDLRACADGTNNDLYQDSELFANENCLVYSELLQKVCEDLIVSGCDNQVNQGPYQEAIGNELTDACLQQLVDQEASVVGDCNELSQLTDQYAIDDCLVDALKLQSICEQAFILGCDNNVDQYVEQNNECNRVVSGSFVQSSKIITHV